MNGEGHVHKTPVKKFYENAGSKPCMEKMMLLSAHVFLYKNKVESIHQPVMDSKMVPALSSATAMP